MISYSVCSGSVGEFKKFFRGDSQEFHLLDHLGQFFIDELLFHLFEYQFLGFVGDEIADASLVVDDASVLHDLIRTHDGVWVDTELDAKLADGKQPVVSLQISA